jgi:uncharacterized protein (TIGR00369 family)
MHMTLTNEDLRARLNAHVPPTGNLLSSFVESVDQEKGTARIRFEARADFCNPMGNVQGGFVAAMLDDAAAIACIVKAQARIVVPTLEFKVSFFAPAKQGILYAEGRTKKFGRTVAFLEADLFDAKGKLLASMTATCLPTPIPDKPNFVERT